MIDLHAHLLPGIDDGPPDEPAAVEMAKAAVIAGVTAMAATPHIDHQHRIAVSELGDRRAQLAATLEREGIALEVLSGGEITVTRLMELETAEMAALALGHGRHLLLECPFVQAGTLFDSAVYTAQAKGFDVLLGHPERSPQFLGHMERLEALVERGAHVQVTAASLSGRFGRTVQEFSLEALERGLVHVIASDAHDAVKRPPGVDADIDAIAARVPALAEQRDWWTVSAPAAIAAGERVGEPPAVRVKRPLLRRLRRR